MRKIVLSGLLLVFCGVYAVAQDHTKGEIGAGWNYLHYASGGGVNGNLSESSTSGAFIDGTYYFKKWVGLTMEFSFNQKTFPVGELSRTAAFDTNLWDMMWGPRFKGHYGRVEPFAQGLVGFARISAKPAVSNPTNLSDTAAAFKIGGGLDVGVARHFAVRLAEVNYYMTRFGTLEINNKGTQNNFTVGTGIVFKLGVPPEGPPPSASCSVQPTDVYAGEPVSATAHAMNFNPKRTLSYSWSATGGKISGKDSTVSVDTTGLSPGSYTASANLTDGKKGQASCQASFSIKERPKNPPQVTCSANPRSVMAGTPSTITCSCSSPDNAPDYPVSASISNWSATGGRISGSGNTATLDTTGASPGPITATATCTDSRGLSVRGTGVVNVEAPAAPPQASMLNVINFTRNSARVDNTAKAILDDVALRLQRDADARAVIVGYANPAELKPATLAAQRAANAKAYLTKEKGIDPSRIETRTGTGSHEMQAEIWLVPAGASFNQPGTEVVNEPATKAPYGHHAPAKKKKAQ